MAFFDSIKKILTKVNPFFDDFENNKVQNEIKRDAQINKNKIGTPDFENIGQTGYNNANQPSYGDCDEIDITSIDFDPTSNDKKTKVQQYRDMAKYPEISDAIDNITDDAIVEDEKGKIVSLNLKEEVPENIEKKIKIEFDYILTVVLKFHERGWDMFRKWLIDSEIYLEIVLDKSKKNIIGVQVLPVIDTMPLYRGNTITGFLQKTFCNNPDNIKGIPFNSNQVVYINFGTYGKNLLDVRGYLDPAIKTYNQIKNLEDALVIYRLVRAPERRLFNIDVGRMPKGKAEEYIKGLIKKYKKKLTYDPNSGAIDSSQNIVSLTEDFWFAKTPEGGSNIETLSSNLQLGEIDDVKYFLQKLYKTLKLPRSRWEDPGVTFSSGKMGEITREEIKFSRFVERLQRRFKYVFIELLMLQLKMKKIDEKYIKQDLFDFVFTKSNLFKEYKERELVDQKINVWNSVSQYVATPNNPSDGIFSREFAMKRFMGMTDEEYDLNEEMRKKELKKLTKDFPNADPELYASAEADDTKYGDGTPDEIAAAKEKEREKQKAEGGGNTPPWFKKKAVKEENFDDKDKSKLIRERVELIKDLRGGRDNLNKINKSINMVKK